MSNPNKPKYLRQFVGMVLLSPLLMAPTCAFEPDIELTGKSPVREESRERSSLVLPLAQADEQPVLTEAQKIEAFDRKIRVSALYYLQCLIDSEINYECVDQAIECVLKLDPSQKYSYTAIRDCGKAARAETNP